MVRCRASRAPSRDTRPDGAVQGVEGAVQDTPPDGEVQGIEGAVQDTSCCVMAMVPSTGCEGTINEGARKITVVPGCVGGLQVAAGLRGCRRGRCQEENGGARLRERPGRERWCSFIFSFFLIERSCAEAERWSTIFFLSGR
ncbi:unnamed protein product [Alopecurus aequalis]